MWVDVTRTRRTTQMAPLSRWRSTLRPTLVRYAAADLCSDDERASRFASNPAGSGRRLRSLRVPAPTPSRSKCVPGVRCPVAVVTPESARGNHVDSDSHTCSRGLRSSAGDLRCRSDETRFRSAHRNRVLSRLVRPSRSSFSCDALDARLETGRVDVHPDPSGSPAILARNRGCRSNPVAHTAPAAWAESNIHHGRSGVELRPDVLYSYWIGGESAVAPARPSHDGHRPRVARRTSSRCQFQVRAMRL